MTEVRFKVRRLVIALAAFSVALLGLANAPAYASDTSSREGKGKIEVCKKVLGPGDHREFKFVIKKKDDGKKDDGKKDDGKKDDGKKDDGKKDDGKKDDGKKDDGKIIKAFTLKKNECKKVDVKKGKHSVTEYVPKDCKIKMIHIKGDENKNIKDPKKATVWVDVKKDKTVKVTFFDKCKKEDRKD